MAANVEYVARETASNLWRNRLMTIAAVLTVAVSLSLVGAALLLRQGVAHATTQWQHGVNVDVFLVAGISPAQEKAIDQDLLQLPYVRSCIYRSSAYDLNEARHLLSPEAAGVLTLSTMPSSLRCVLNDPNEAPAVAQQFNGTPGVERVVWPSQAVRNMQEVTRILQWVFFILAVILLLSASVLILNTIRLAIFARRREVSVMKLVGATNWFIRIPFMFEGLVQGLAGALVAALSVFGLHMVLNALGNNTTGNVFTQMRMSAEEVLVTCAVVVVIGLLVGTVGSALAIRRFLET
jgi:cell division transport system permease protein